MNTKDREAQAIEALRPFAEVAQFVEHVDGEVALLIFGHISHTVTVNDLREAARVVAEYDRVQNSIKVVL